MHAPIHHVAKKVDDLGSHARSSRSERVGAEHEDRPNDVLRQRRPDPDGMAADEIALERPQLVVRHTHGREIAEPGVDAVDGILALRDLGDDLCGLTDLALRGTVEAHRNAPARDPDDVGDGEVVTGEPEGGYFKFSRYQAPSSV